MVTFDDALSEEFFSKQQVPTPSISPSRDDSNDGIILPSHIVEVLLFLVLMFQSDLISLFISFSIILEGQDLT